MSDPRTSKPSRRAITIGVLTVLAFALTVNWGYQNDRNRLRALEREAQTTTQLADAQRQLTEADASIQSNQKLLDAATAESGVALDCLHVVMGEVASLRSGARYLSSQAIDPPAVRQSVLRPCRSVLRSDPLLALASATYEVRGLVNEAAKGRTPAMITVTTTTQSSATARCNDGTLSYSEHASGTCSWHGGVDVWINYP